MGRYRLTNAANADLDRLYVFGALTFGIDQADSYAAGMLKRFNHIADNPYQWQGVFEIKAGYRRSVYQAHSIYYRIDPEEVIILRILGQQDIDDALLDDIIDDE